MLFHVDHDVVARDHQQLVLCVQRKNAHSGLVRHVFDFPATSHLVTFHVNERAQIDDGGVALHCLLYTSDAADDA